MTSSPATTFEDVLAEVADVEGWMTDDQARKLWNAARSVPENGRIVEIGSFRGRSLIVLASAATRGVEIVSIDPHAGNDRGPQEIEGFVDQAVEDHDVFNRNLSEAGVADRVTHLRKFSDDALGDVTGPIDVLYIDGAHRFAPARSDIVKWGAKVADGGDLLIHDSFSSVGVTLALVTTLFFGSDFRYVGRAQSMTHYRRHRMGPRERLRNGLRQLAELPWFARNVLIKVLIVAKLGSLTRFLGHDEPTWPY
ncbi:MAG: class I SAM-dependent methyltransferase [Acidimicrobiales bacterium]|nr:class I SAM-dependent methyltransferase [Acidimicrobiales bacterium]